MTEIQKKLFELQDIEYRNFQAKLIPGVPFDSVIGVRTPELKALAKSYGKLLSGKADFSEADGVTAENIRFFLSSAPHRYFDENQLHAFILGEQKEFDLCVSLVDEFLPFVDNWATCDQLSPKVFAKNKSRLIPYVQKWLDSGKTYTVRFGLGMLMRHFLETSSDAGSPGFSPEHLEKAASLCRPFVSNADDNYYVNMMISWYFATALAKQWTVTFEFMKGENCLNEWCFRKSLQKARESFRISPEHKDMLRNLAGRS